MRTIKYFAMTLAGAFMLSSAAMAQDDGGDMNKKGESGDISIGFNYDLSPNVNLGGFLGGGGASSPSPGNQWTNDAFGNAQIFGRYYLSDDLAVRAGLGFSSSSSTSVSKDSTWGNAERNFEDQDENPVVVDGGDSAAADYQESETNVSQTAFSIAPGIEKHFSTNSNIDPYVGAEIPIAILGSQSRDSTITKEGYQLDATSGDMREVSYEYSDNRENPGGFGIGLNAIVGFNWFVDDKVAIGMEYSLGFMNVSTGGEVTGSRERSAESNVGSVSGDISNTADENIWNHENENSNTNIRTRSRGGINVSIFF